MKILFLLVIILIVFAVLIIYKKLFEGNRDADNNIPDDRYPLW